MTPERIKLRSGYVLRTRQNPFNREYVGRNDKLCCEYDCSGFLEDVQISFYSRSYGDNERCVVKINMRMYFISNGFLTTVNNNIADWIFTNDLDIISKIFELNFDIIGKNRARIL